MRETMCCWWKDLVVWVREGQMAGCYDFNAQVAGRPRLAKDGGAAAAAGAAAAGSMAPD